MTEEYYFHGRFRKAYRSIVLRLGGLEKAMDLVLKIYRHTHSFPRDETYGLASQLRRDAVSIPSNIAEGQARLSTGEFRHFLGQARGSLMEVETQLLIARELGYLQPENSDNLLGASGEVGRMLNGLLNALPHHR